jgi:hypothetical protein
MSMQKDFNICYDKFSFIHTLFFPDLSQYRPVYAPKDFLEVLLCIYSPNYRSTEWVRLSYIHPYWCWILVAWDPGAYIFKDTL